MDIDLVAGVFGADGFQLLGHFAVIELGAGVGIDLQQLGADDGALEVIGHQTADMAGLEHVAAHQIEVLGGDAVFRHLADDRGRHHVATREAGFHHLDETHVRREQRRHRGAVDAGQEEHVIGDSLERLEELRRVDVAAVLGAQRDQHAVGTTERFAVFGEGLHVGVLQRNHLLEAGVDAQLRGGDAEQDRDGREQAEEEFATTEQQVGELLHEGLHGHVT